MRSHHRPIITGNTQLRNIIKLHSWRVRGVNEFLDLGLGVIVDYGLTNVVDDAATAVDKDVLAESGGFAADNLGDVEFLEEVLFVDPCAGLSLLFGLVYS